METSDKDMHISATEMFKSYYVVWKQKRNIVITS